MTALIDAVLATSAKLDTLVGLTALAVAASALPEPARSNSLARIKDLLDLPTPIPRSDVKNACADVLELAFESTGARD